MSGQHCPNCHQCENFRTSWDPKAPYSCGHFGFKCRTLPSYEVLANTGSQCIFFISKSQAQTATFRPVQVLPDDCTFSISA